MPSLFSTLHAILGLCTCVAFQHSTTHPNSTRKRIRPHTPTPRRSLPLTPRLRIDSFLLSHFFTHVCVLILIHYNAYGPYFLLPRTYFLFSRTHISLPRRYFSFLVPSYHELTFSSPTPYAISPTLPLAPPLPSPTFPPSSSTSSSPPPLFSNTHPNTS